MGGFNVFASAAAEEGAAVIWCMMVVEEGGEGATSACDVDDA